MDTKKTIDTLAELLETAKQSESEFRNSADHLKHSDVRHFFRQRAETCWRDALELRRMMAQWRGVPAPCGILEAPKHQAWMAWIAQAEAGGDASLLVLAQTSQSQAIRAYCQALQLGLPPLVHRRVEQQLQRLRACVLQLQELRRPAACAEALVLSCQARELPQKAGVVPPRPSYQLERNFS